MTTRKQVERQAKRLNATLRVSTHNGLDVEVTAPDGFVWAEMGTRVLVGAQDTGGTRADVWEDLALRMDSGLRPVAPATHPAPAGLMEAVGKAKTALEECLLRGASDHSDALCRVALETLAAYDAAKGGEALDKAHVTRVVGDVYREACAAGDDSMAEGVASVALRLDLVLDTPPSGPGGGEKDPDAVAVAKMTDAEVTAELEAAGVDVPSMLARTREHIAQVRARIAPTPNPDGPALTYDCGKPAACVGQYEGHGGETPACDDCCGHGNEDGHCKPIVPATPEGTSLMARPKTAAPGRPRDDGPPAPLPAPMETTGNGTYVKCTACGGMRMRALGGPHAATHVSNPPQPWPQCQHGAAFMADCRSNAVPPPCCRGEA